MIIREVSSAAISRRRRGRRRKVEAARAVGYIRCSTREQQNGPEAQREAITRYAVQHRYELVAVLNDTASGAVSPYERPGLAEAMRVAREQRAAVLLIAKRDRLARDTLAAVYLERDLEQDGIRVEAADGQGNGQTDEAKFMRRILDAFSEYERAKIRARTRAALQSRRARGLRAGSIPYGMRLASDGRLEPHPTEAPIVERIRRERAAGATFESIRAGLERDCVPARGERWHMTTVQAIAKRA